MVGELVTRLPWTSSTLNAHGEETHHRGAGQQVLALAFAPAQSAEVRDGQGERITTPATLYLPSAVATDPRDLWEVRGVRYAAEGESAGWRSPFTGRAPGQVVTLRRVIG